MRHFTLAEATAALGAVRPLAERMVELAASVRATQSELAVVQGRVAGNGHGQALAARVRTLEKTLAGAVEELRAVAEQIHDLGVLVKDVDTGLLDFPARLRDETVLLCWRVGEEAIEHWHGLDEGFAGRKPLSGDLAD